ncbi:MAG: FAD-dependent oxidoreductase [Pseudomonadales bacterium]|nr:FAD-dependent oxidoreductase [Pseudomonadales bacterium]MBO6597801.1 FAD-dependent oxidoreductase [Pseudomonadales bacterium]MBO6824039.1 FAD-dependent oxidoreductase [Pseudomonadales bacterium]
MSAVGTEGNPLRVAIIGSGPAGFYTVSNFQKQKDLVVEFDMFDRLPTPFGLVRAGVAPDHQKDKSVQRAYDKSAQLPNFRFYGNVEYGTDLHMDDLKKHYHQVMFSTGAPFDRNLGVPGEDLAGSFSATEFVAWYNGHPDFKDRQFDLSQESVAVVGIGNVAMDVARILCKTHEELAVTDIADHALEALKNSNVKNVYILGRRGPAQAAFTPPEIKEMGEFADADVTVLSDEAVVDEASAVLIADDKNAQKNVGFIQEYAERPIEGKSKLLTIRFLVSPTELIGEDGKVSAIRLVKNELVAGDDGSIRPKATDQEETIPVGLVFRSVGYKGLPLPNVPYHESWGTILNEAGRVVDDSGAQVTGLYTAGWIKRGPSGVIGTNKTCAQETVGCMVEDLTSGNMNHPEDASIEGAAALIASRTQDAISYSEWSRIDEAELAKGEAQGRPRVKFTEISEMLDVAKS